MDQTLLREILEEHASQSSADGVLQNASYAAEWKSAKTGNLCRVQIEADHQQIIRIAAQVDGSALAKACASIMCSELQRVTIDQAHAIHGEILKWVEHRVAPKKWKGELVVYESLVQFPERMDCAMLCWGALKLALQD